jgi:hypothetical protein
MAGSMRCTWRTALSMVMLLAAFCHAVSVDTTSPKLIAGSYTYQSLCFKQPVNIAPGLSLTDVTLAPSLYSATENGCLSLTWLL